MAVHFGVAGNSASFFTMGYAHLLQVPKYLKKFELDAYEYQCGHGVRLSEQKAKEFKKLANDTELKLSVHSPYYISLSSIEEAKREKSVGYILQTAILADNIGAQRIVVHSGSAGKVSRQDALELAKSTLKKAVLKLKSEGLSHINICPETMGKVNQLGTLAEVLELCLIDESFIPCIDFGHINAREQGLLKNKEEFLNLFNSIENKLGIERVKQIHIHFSKIKYTTGGEQRHLTFADNIYGPNHEDLLDVILKKHCEPIIICESDGTQAEDAKAMKTYYQNISKS
ncbi:MAG: TIM barrel protein [Oscillospiraceae bacterium]